MYVVCAHAAHRAHGRRVCYSWADYAPTTAAARQRLSNGLDHPAAAYDLVVIEPDLGPFTEPELQHDAGAPAESPQMNGYALCEWWVEQCSSDATRARQRSATIPKQSLEASQPKDPTSDPTNDPTTDPTSGSPSSRAFETAARDVIRATEFVAISELPDAVACAKAGITYCFAKPFSIRCFATLMSKWLTQ